MLNRTLRTSAHAEDSADVPDLLRRHPELRELVEDRRRFFVPAWTVFGIGYAGFLVLPAVAPGVFGMRIGTGLSVGIILAVAYTILMFALATSYGRRAKRWDALTNRIATGDAGPSEGRNADAC